MKWRHRRFHDRNGLLKKSGMKRLDRAYRDASYNMGVNTMYGRPKPKHLRKLQKNELDYHTRFREERSKIHNKFMDHINNVNENTGTTRKQRDSYKRTQKEMVALHNKYKNEIIKDVMSRSKVNSEAAHKYVSSLIDKQSKLDANWDHDFYYWDSEKKEKII